jgi:pimeloyl-ACP methyl ester carboxylesterase
MGIRDFRSVSLAFALVWAATLSPAEAQQHEEGQAGGGAMYAIDVPGAWNGDLIVYGHGIVDPALPVALPAAQDDFASLRGALLARGFAVAASSYDENGFALKDAVQRTHQLVGIFTDHVTRPRRVVLAGHSLGAMAVLALAESYPEQFDGALVMCGFTGGTTREIEYMADARTAFDYFFPGVIPGSTFEIPSDLDFRPGTPLFLRIQAALVAGFAPPFRTVQWAHVVRLPGNGPAEMIAAGLNVLGFNLRYTRDVLEHTHGHIPFDNRDTIYSGSLDDDALNTGIRRWTGDPDALRQIATYYTPTGDLRVPVQTLHGDRDPVVPAWHEDRYNERVTEQGALSALEQQVVPSFGHCVFDRTQVLTAFDRLMTRIDER